MSGLLTGHQAEHLNLNTEYSMQDDRSNSGRVAGIDFGTVRIGIAITDVERKIASPYENYSRRDQAADEKYFQELVKQEEIVLLVVGLPVHMSGDESQKSREARQFGDWLSASTGLPVEYVDERYTTRHAEQLLHRAQLTAKQRRRRRDMLAAQMILTTFIESNR